MNEIVLFPSMHDDETLESLKKTLELRENELAELEMQFNTLQINLNEFEILYRKYLSEHYARLDALKLNILELINRYQLGLVSKEELQDARDQAKKSNQEYQERQKKSKPEAPVEEFKPSETLKELYRKAVKLMHPDLSNNPEEKALRTKLLSKINEAYTHGKEEEIREILAHWQEGKHLDTNGNAEIAAISRRILLADKGIQKIKMELRALKQDRLFELWQTYQAAKNEGRNLLEELAQELLQQTVTILATMKSLAR